MDGWLGVGRGGGHWHKHGASSDLPPLTKAKWADEAEEAVNASATSSWSSVRLMCAVESGARPPAGEEAQRHLLPPVEKAERKILAAAWSKKELFSKLGGSQFQDTSCGLVQLADKSGRATVRGVKPHKQARGGGTVCLEAHNRGGGGGTQTSHNASVISIFKRGGEKKRREAAFAIKT